MFSFHCWHRKTRKPNLNIQARSTKYCRPRWVFWLFCGYSRQYCVTWCYKFYKLDFTSYVVVMVDGKCALSLMWHVLVIFISHTVRRVNYNGPKLPLYRYKQILCQPDWIFTVILFAFRLMKRTNREPNKNIFLLLFSFLFFIRHAGHRWVLFRRWIFKKVGRNNHRSRACFVCYKLTLISRFKH